MSKRIYQYPEVTELQEGDVMLIDKEGNETAKSILASKVAPALMSKTITERGVYKASDDGVRGYNEVNVNIPYTDIHVASGAIATFEGEDLPLKSLTASIVPVQAGSGDPSPTNVRPISGWTEEVVSLRGINQWDEQWELGYYDADGLPQPSLGNIRNKEPIMVKGLPSVYIKSATQYGLRIRGYDINKSVNYDFGYVNNQAISIPSNVAYITYYTNAADNVTTYNNDISINYPSTDTEYHAYSGTTTTIPFTDSQGQSVEVFGGTLDVTSGVLTVDRAMVTYDGSSDENWVDNMFQYGYSINKGSFKSNVEGKSNYLKYSFGGTSDSSYYIGTSYLNVRLDFVTSLADFKTYLSSHPLQICSELATPTTFYTQPTSIKSLDGDNNVGASTGDVDVEYQTVWVRPTE